jgi:putative peptidoglycan lipid II flippase
MNHGPAEPAAGAQPSSSAPLLRSASVTGSMTLLSRISGLARDIVFANAFGAGRVMDIFVFAFRLPNLLRRFFAEGAFAQAFVPVIAEYRSTRSLAQARDLIARVSGTLAVCLFVVTLIGVVAAPVLVYVFGTGIAVDGDDVGLATAMLRLTFPYIFFISLTAMAGAVLNTWGRFAVPAFTPLLLNLVLISAAIWLAPALEVPVLALAIGVFIAGLIQLLFQLPFLLRAGLLPRPRLGFGHPTVRRILTLMLPVLFGSSIAQINILFDTWLALFLEKGSVTWLYYSDRLVEFPLGVFGIALATVILPTLSSQHARESGEAFTATIDWGLRSVLLIGVPAAVALFVLAGPLIATLFFRGSFDEVDVAMAAASLMAFAPGLLGFILVKVLVAAFYSRQDMRTPVGIAVKALLLGMLLNVVFVLTLLQTGWAPAHAGLAAATSLSSLTNASLLLFALRRTGVYRPTAGWLGLGVRVTLASGAMVAALFWLLAIAGDWTAMTTLGRSLWLFAAVAGGAAVYFVAALAVGLRPAQFRSPA